jgi:hypothetical protein
MDLPRHGRVRNGIDFITIPRGGDGDTEACTGQTQSHSPSQPTATASDDSYFGLVDHA